MAKKQNINLASPLLYILLGVLLVVFKAQMLNWAMTFAGLFFILIGLVDLVKGRAASGVINIAIGVIILVVGWTLVNIVLLVLGVFIAAKGVMSLIEILKRPKKNALSVVFAALTIAIGVALAFGDLLGNLIVVLGVLLIIDGVLGLIGAKKLR